ncbi:squamosa promoter-binding-like protein 9 isoform X3 [Elaeis guineensis]|uniref:Squamosa promoter-binding-like protein 9 isoform X1 n=1 Tax=Elaeis guineensis var. tenera TaxID=51953 RepID=A0A6I9QWI3_ELAGV|nr:squamosa promoter-binding-like protein 9 isoform X1 [Elaeis guineensis]
MENSDGVAGEGAEPGPAVTTTVTAALEWGGLLDFTIYDDGPLFLPWDGLEDRPQDDAAAAAPPPLPPPRAAGSVDRVRKRDVRLVCSNYLEGRIPCSCPEAEEAAGDEGEGAEVAVPGVESSKGKKRARTGGPSIGPLRCQVPGCEADIGELKGYHQRHRVCLRCAYAPSVVLDGEPKRYCQQCGKFHILTDFDEGKRSCRRKLERHNKRRRRRPTDLINIVEEDKEHQGDISVDDNCAGKPRKETIDGFACGTVETAVSNKLRERETLLESEDGHGSPFHSLSSFNNVHSNSIMSFTTSDEAQIDEKIDNSQSGLSTFCDNKSGYSSVCPTGRISFKLYDWNPADFPRRLRHQIFQWLASMPVELEGYIRPGCTMLTVFIAMPHFMWEKLSQDAAGYVKDLVCAPESLFLGRGNIHIYLNNNIIQVLEDATLLNSIRMEVQVPRLHYVFPTFFEAGKPMEFIACGSYLDQPKFRFLVSFAGKYLSLESCHAMCHKKISECSGNGVGSISSTEHEVFRINITQTDSEIFGPAFIEVENESGISNFVPILFGNKHICSQLKRMHGAFSESLCADSSISQTIDTVANPGFCKALVLKQNSISELLLDIAWLLKEPRLEETETLLSSTNIHRLTCLLRFLIQNEAFIFLEEILHFLDVIDWEGLDDRVDKALDVDLRLFLNYMNHAREILHQRIPHDGKSELDIIDSISRASMPQSYAMNDGNNAVPCLNQSMERRDKDGSGSTTTPATQANDETVPLLTRDGISGQICRLNSGTRWTSESWGIFPSTRTSIRAALFITGSVVLCFVACVALFHPHMAGEFADSLRRLLLTSRKTWN